MRIISGARATAVAIAALGAAWVPATASADDCPNASFRTGTGATLPDCRAYEQVSPRDKNGVGMYPFISTYASPGGDRVFSGATGAVVPTDSAYQFRGFTSGRAGDWSTRGVDAPAPRSDSIGSLSTLALSDDGKKALSASPYVLAPGGVEGATNLYVRDLTQPNAFSLMASIPGTAFLNELGFYAGPIIDATPDLGTIAIATPTQLLPDVPPPSGGAFYVYFARGGELTLASRDAVGEPRPADGIVNPPNEEHRLSDDGLTVTWKPQGAATYVRTTRGGGVVDIGRSRTGGPAAGAVSVPPLSTADGSRTFFAASGPLTAASTPGSWAIYRSDAAGDGLTDLTASITATTPAQNVDLVSVSPDARLVWFTTPSQLVPDDGTAGDPRLYVLDADAGTVDLVAVFDATLGLSGNLYRFSPDGRRIAIRTDTALANASNALTDGCKRNNAGGRDGYCGQIYTWNARTPDQPVTCVSCLPGAQQIAVAGFGPDFGRVPIGGRINRAITNDGRVFFDTAAPLVARDTDTVPDVYQSTPDAGRALLSAGASGTRALFADATPDGASVYFHTGQRLVPQDADDLTDLYVARTSGGIAAQQAVPPAPGDGCAGEACRPGGAVQPARPPQGSATFVEPEPGLVPRFALTKPSRRALRTAGRRGRLVLPVRVNAAGTLSARLDSRLGGRRLRTVACVVRRASEAGTARLTLRLSRAARRHLRRTGRLNTRLIIAYSERTQRYRTSLTFTTGRTGSDRGGAR